MTVEGTGLHLIERGAPETLSMQWYADGNAADPGATTIGIVDARGTTVVAAGTATAGSTTAPRTYALAASAAASLNLLYVTWTPTNYGAKQQTVEIIGQHLFTIDEARDWDDEALANGTTYPQPKIERMRARVLNEFQEICGVAFTPRYRLVEVDGPGRCDLLLPSLRVTRIRSVEYRLEDTDWTAFDADELADLRLESWGRVRRNTRGYFTPGAYNWRVGYEHGWEQPPIDIADAAMTVARYLLVPSNLSSRALQQNAQFGTIQLATAGRYGDFYGIPSVDSVLDRRAERVPGFA